MEVGMQGPTEMGAGGMVAEQGCRDTWKREQCLAEQGVGVQGRMGEWLCRDTWRQVSYAWLREGAGKHRDVQRCLTEWGIGVQGHTGQMCLIKWERQGVSQHLHGEDSPTP